MSIKDKDMNKNIDLAKILKNCPKGWKFYSILYGEVEFISVNPKKWFLSNCFKRTKT